MNDELNIIAFKTFTTADMVSASNGGTFQGNVDFAAGIDVTGNITVTGTVDGRDVAADGIVLDGLAGAGSTIGGYAVDLTGITAGSILKFDGVKFVVSADNSGVTEVDGGGSASVYDFTIDGGNVGSVYTPIDAIDGGNSSV